MLKALNDKVSGAALRYHIKAALNKSHSIEAFKQNLNKIANRAEFSNATKALIREIEQNLPKSVESGGTQANTASEVKALESGQSEAPVKVQGEAQTKANNAYQELAKIDTTKLNPEQQEILKVFKGEIPSTTIVGKDLKDLYRLETGSRKIGARKIIIKHFGTEKTGGLSADELLNIGAVIKDGHIDSNSLELQKDLLRYAYTSQTENGTTLRVVVDELNNGKKIFDFYSDRNFIDYKGGYSPKLPTATKEATTSPLNSQEIPYNPAFGTNFEEFYHNPQGAIAKLIEAKEGQVAGAFYREDLGDIDLVWGNSKMGLAHILERRTQQYGEEKALKFIQELPRMVEQSKVYKNTTDKIELITPEELVVIGKRDQNRFIITGFKDRRSKDRFKQLDNPQSLDDAGFADKSVSEQPKKVGDILLPNQEKPTTPPLKSQEPKLLTYKPVSEIYKEAKAKGLSYAEFKALREQEKATRALHTTRYIEFKKAESQNIKDLLDPSKPLKMLKPEQITERLLDQVKKHNAKVWVGELKDLKLANKLKLDTNHPIKITFNGSALTHVEKQHGIHSIHYLKNKQPPIGIQDVRDYPKVINEADIHQLTRDKHNQLMLTSAKQINGYFVVVESISTKHNELKLKTLYKENGKLENNPLFSGVNMRTTQVAETSLSPKPSVSHALTHTKEDITTPALKNQDELAPEVQELLAKDKIKWYYKKAINKHLGLENGDYIPNLSPDVKNILNCTATN
ncbi:hypothetical protein [Helicobacter suis]|uniref:PBECR3 domain-containing polyvalent protein n=1 Tax=Helicobacter suis TaxID=104628 RepID=UPI0013D65432|nr:hypothetical protein [Helicobacter suis]